MHLIFLTARPLLLTLILTLSWVAPARAIEIAIPSDMYAYTWTGQPDQVSPGITLLTPASRILPENTQRGYLIGVDESGEIVFYKQEPGFSIVLFNPENSGGRYVQSIGWPRFPEAAVILDSGLVTQDTIPRLHPDDPNLYLDLHDLYVDDDNHIWTQWRQPVTVDLSQYIDGGHPNATVLHDIIQRWDPAGNVVWEWRAIDHLDELPYTGNNDTTALYEPFVEHMVINGFSFAPDGDLIVSARGMSLALRIDVPTGGLEWKFGGGSLNDFAFLGDGGGQPLDFHYQHDVRMDDEGVITLLDNGLAHDPPRTYAREYTIDPDTQTATLTWLEYDEDDLWASTITGSHRVLPGGHRLIGWGANSPPVTATEYDENDQPVWELAFDFDHGTGLETVNYRAVKVPAIGPATTPYLSSVKHDDPARFELLCNWWGHEDEITAYKVFVSADGEPYALHGVTDSGVYLLDDISPFELHRVRVLPVDAAGDPVGPPSNVLELFHAASGLTLEPITTWIPSGGGTLEYLASVVNASDDLLSGLRFRPVVVLPNGTEFGPLRNTPFFLNPWSAVWDFSAHQVVPANAPAGIYQYIGRVWQGGEVLWEDGFEFIKADEPGPAATQPAMSPGDWPVQFNTQGKPTVRRIHQQGIDR